jgi:prepilin-type N-terminal cleavage/methylation domain-containing protein
MVAPRSDVHRRGMRHPGYTLLETLAALALLGVVLGIALPPAARWRDHAAVRAARDEIAAELAGARMAAVAHGGARLVVDPATGLVWVTTSAGHVEEVVDLANRYGVRLLAGAGGPVPIPYDALGIGRLASRTIEVRRGRASAGLTVSAYGRVRRW